MTTSNPCTNCQEAVQSRRPSKSGVHFCTRPSCQAAKQRFYRHRKAGEAETKLRELLLQLIHALVNQERTPCHLCGLSNALAGWAHRNESGLAPCFGTGNLGNAELVPYMDTVWPDRVPS